MWRGVLFDLGDTLIDGHPLPKARHEELIARGFEVWLRSRSMGTVDEFSPDERAKLAETGGQRLVDAVNKGLEEAAVRYWAAGLEAPPGSIFATVQSELAAATGLAASSAELEEVYLKGWLGRQRVLPGAAELLGALRDAGLKLGLVSNCFFSREFMDAYLRRHGLARFFGAIVYSGEVGYRKPRAQIIQVALSQLGVPPGSSVLVGDDPRTDLAGARAARMDGLWFWGHNELTEGLEPGPALGAGTWPDLARLPELGSYVGGLLPASPGAKHGVVAAARSLREVGDLLLATA